MTRLEKENPKIAELVKQLGGKVYYQGGAYRMSLGGTDEQLTGYTSRRGKPIGEAENIEIALTKLQKHLDGRASWGSVQERSGALLAKLREAVAHYRPGHFMTVYEYGGDAATMFAAGYSPIMREAGLTREEWERREPKSETHKVYFELIGEPRWEYTGPDFAHVIDHIEADLVKAVTVPE